MPFQLSIKHNIESASDHFGAGRVKVFEDVPVRVGRGEECECRIDDSEYLPVHFTLRPGGAAGNWQLVPGTGALVFVNRARVESTRDLRSGDELRVGHWTLRFHKMYAHVGQARKADLAAILAKALVAAILLTEIFLVVWLPRRLRSSALWDIEVARQQTVQIADALRRRVREDDEDPLVNAARALIGTELGELATLITAYEDSLTREQWQKLREELDAYAAILDNMDRGEAFPPVPELDFQAGFEQAIRPPQKGSRHE